MKDLLISCRKFKANIVEYFKAGVIKSRIYYERRLKLKQKSATCEADKGWQRKRNFGDCSFRLTSQLTGLSLGHLHGLSKIQTISKYYKRYCPEFDSLRLKTVKQLNHYIALAAESGVKLEKSMFEFHKGRHFGWRKRISDYIATSAEITNRTLPGGWKHI